MKYNVKNLEIIIDYCEHIENAISSPDVNEEEFCNNYILQSSCSFSLL